MNQSYGHWLFGDTLQFIISTCRELRDEIVHYIVFDNLVDLDVIIFYAKLEKLQICMKFQILKMFLFFIFSHGFDRKKVIKCWCLCLILGLKTCV
jgi:hypothetical protein